ncbi:hypothetical protein JRQ81_017442 [Phrynocephalus forsythii]|uniref:Sepiapterin reductase n=1 Tax=Phrynocephalus forsythii TaxID=171643 RepID=A0A9Q0XRB1_9SAUR|nr:hypothetical protein JRQ81_017442 [Phrynocephalus forsythii]
MASSSSSSSGEPSGPGLGWVACLVTGASWGFGQSVARLVAARLAPGSLLLLAARSAGAPGELEGELRAAYPELRVQALPADLGADEGLQRVAWDTAAALRCHHDGAHLQRLLLLNNVGDWPAGTRAGRGGLSPPACGGGHHAPALFPSPPHGPWAGDRVPGPLASFAGGQPAGCARRDGRSAGEW